MPSCFLRRRRTHAGFTLLETLAAAAVMMLVLVALAQVVGSVEKAWRAGSADPFGEAQLAFETVAQNLSAATLETYRDYADASGAFRPASGANFTPDHSARRSDLAFACGPASSLLAGSGRTTGTDAVFFLVPGGTTQLFGQTGLNHLLNAKGYFLEFGGDADAPAFFMGPGRRRWRLKEIAQPSESLQVFASPTSAAWISQLAGSGATPSVLAENVIALVVLPERAASDSDAVLAPAFAYDSRNAANQATFAQLPPRMRVVLVAIDEASAQKLAAKNDAAVPALVDPSLFQSAAKLDADLAALDGSLTAAGIQHRIYQRDIVVASSAWSNSP